jgi:hypothetical protein
VSDETVSGYASSISPPRSSEIRISTACVPVSPLVVGQVTRPEASTVRPAGPRVRVNESGSPSGSRAGMRNWYVRFATAVRSGEPSRTGTWLVARTSIAKDCVAESPKSSVTRRVTACDPTWSAAGDQTTAPASSIVRPTGPATTEYVNGPASGSRAMTAYR